MADVSAEKLSQRLLDVNLLDDKQLDTVWGELGTRDVPLDDFVSMLVRKEFATNFQIERCLRGERLGYFYGKWKVLYFIGSGSFARVFRAINTETGKVAAVKVLRSRYRDDVNQTDQFLREAKMGQMLKHINVCPIWDVQNDRGTPYMVMEFVEGQTLRDLVRLRKKLDPMVSLKLMTDIGAGLSHAADKGISHRDLKLSNVLVTSLGRAKLVDFGLAAATKSADDDKLADCPSARAIDYATLERGTGVRKDDVRSDLFFAGCMFYHMVSGESPLFETRDRAQRLNFSRFREIKPLSQVAPGLPNSVAIVINKAMSLDAQSRYMNPHEFHAELKAAMPRLEKELSGNAADSSAQGTSSAAASQGEALTDGQSRPVMIVESKPEIQNLLRDRLKKHGYRVLIVSDPERALQRFRDDGQVADCVMFCTPKLGGAALDAFNRFGKDEETRDIPAILFADERQKSLLENALLSDNRIVMAAPLKVKTLILNLQRLLAASPSHS